MVNLNNDTMRAGNGAWLTVKQTSQRLGVSTGCIYQLVASGKLDSIRVGVGRGTIRISEAALNSFVESSAKPKTRAPRAKSSRKSAFRHLNTNRLLEAWGESPS